MAVKWKKEQILEVIRTAWNEENLALAMALERLQAPGIAAWLIGSLTLQGRLNPGDRLPNNTDIGRVLDISGHSVSLGFQLLAERGVLLAKKNAGGTRVIAPGTQEDLNAITQMFRKRDPEATPYPQFPSQADRSQTHQLAVEARAANPAAPGRESVLAMVDEIADNGDYPEGAALLAIPKSGMPLLQLSTLVMEEKLPPGSYVPSERFLAERYGIPATAARAALTALADAGVVDSRRGRSGSVVAATPTQQVYLQLTTLACQFPNRGLRSTREHRESKARIARIDATANLEAALYRDLDALTAAQQDPFAAAAYLAQGIDEALGVGDPLASQTSLITILGHRSAWVDKVRHILGRAGWVDVQQNRTLVKPPEERTRTPEQIRAGDVPPPLSPDKPYIPAIAGTNPRRPRALKTPPNLRRTP